MNGKEVLEESKAIKKLTFYLCSKCPEDERLKKPYKTENGRNNPEVRVHSYNRYVLHKKMQPTLT